MSGSNGGGDDVHRGTQTTPGGPTVGPNDVHRGTQTEKGGTVVPDAGTAETKKD
jgi:hypothetical protein